MPDVLEFNPNRDLAFNPNRDRLFDPERNLLFDPQRSLDFDPGRDLPFGKRGVVFRGFICPICGASRSGWTWSFSAREGAARCCGSATRRPARCS